MARKKKKLKKLKKYSKRLLDRIVDVGVVMAAIDESEFENLGAQVMARAKERGIKTAAWEHMT